MSARIIIPAAGAGSYCQPLAGEAIAAEDHDATRGLRGIIQAGRDLGVMVILFCPAWFGRRRHVSAA